MGSHIESKACNRNPSHDYRGSNHRSRSGMWLLAEIRASQRHSLYLSCTPDSNFGRKEWQAVISTLGAAGCPVYSQHVRNICWVGGASQVKCHSVKRAHTQGEMFALLSSCWVLLKPEVKGKRFTWSNMSSQDEFSQDDWSQTGNERNGFGDHQQPLLLGDSSNTLETSVLDRAQLFPLMETRLYRRRWLMLFIFCSCSMSNGFMWLQYSIIGDIFMRFYSVESMTIDWLSMTYCLTYIPLILPVTWLLDNRGMREVMVVGSAFNCIGAWIKTGTASPDMFAMTFLGQFVCSVAAVYFLGIPSRLASLWFGQQEVSTACSIGVLGNQVCLCLPVSLNLSFAACVWCYRLLKLAVKELCEFSRQALTEGELYHL